MPCILFLWPLILRSLYGFSVHLTAILLTGALFVGGRFFYLRNARDDETSYLFYNVRISPRWNFSRTDAISGLACHRQSKHGCTWLVNNALPESMVAGLIQS